MARVSPTALCVVSSGSAVSVAWPGVSANNSNMKYVSLLVIISIEAMILKNRFRWVGHVIRMEDNRQPKKPMFGELAKRFKDCVKASISHAEKITLKELEPHAHDMTGWRTFTRHAMDTFEERRRTQIEEARERRTASADAPSNPGLFPCPHCPRTCKSRIGLHSHLRAHGRREQR